MSGAKGFPWARMMQTAIRFGIAPDQFWQLSLREWQMLTRTRTGTDFRKTDLSRLIAAYPDKEATHGQ